MKKFLVMILVFIFYSNLFGETVNLEQVRTLGLINSRSLSGLNLSLQNSLLNERNLFFQSLPSLSMGYSAGVSYLDENWEFVNPIDTFNSRLNLTVSYRIFDGGRSRIQRELASISTESVRRQALAEYFNVLDSVDNAYYAVLEAAASLESEESTLQTAIFSLSMAEIRLASGMINYGDYLRALADMEQRENSRNQARRSLNLSITRLRSLTGLPELPELEPVDFSKYEDLIFHLGSISDSELELLFSNFWEHILVSNHSLARSILSNMSAELNHSLTQRQYMPTISASIISPSISYSTRQGFDHGSGGGSVSITGSIPIDYWVYNNTLERSRIALEQSAMDYVGAEINLEIELYSALLNCISLAGSVISSRRSLEYVELHFEFVMERYRLLQSSISDLQDASTMLINSRNSHTRSVYGFLQSLSRLRSLGAFDDEDLLINLLMGA